MKENNVKIKIVDKDNHELLTMADVALQRRKPDKLALQVAEMFAASSRRKDFVVELHKDDGTVTRFEAFETIAVRGMR